jgi:long-chain fatty acid transport protein
MRKALATAAVLLVVPSLTFGAGFALFESGTRSFAMAGAFVAVADDPSAMFWNSAGLAFQDDKGTQLMMGAILIAPEQTFYGEDPYPGEGYSTEQEDQIFFPPHFQFVTPLGERTTFGFAVQVPFGLGTYWDDDHAGRFLSKRVDLLAYDLTPNLAFKLNDNLALGVGVDYRISTISLTRDVPLIDPFSQQAVDIAQVHIYTDGAGNDGWGWHAGMLAKLGKGWSFGLTYRSAITVDYEGYADFFQFGTGNPELDAIVAQTIPFGETVEGSTEIEFPDFWIAGFAWTGERFTVSAEWGRMGWSSVREIVLTFPDYPDFTDVIPEYYEDVDQYRLGFEYRASQRIALQLGTLYDETPQPPEAMTPLLGDGDRTSITCGLSWIKDNFRLDLGYEYLMMEDRSTWDAEDGSLSGYNGHYESSANLAGASMTFTF